MQSQAYKITGFAAVTAALGFMLRWLQGLAIYEEETGLAKQNAPISAWLVGLMLVTAAVLAVWCVSLRKYPACRSEAALVGKTPLHTVVGSVAGAVLVLAGAVMLFTAGSYASVLLRRFLALLTVMAGVSAVLVTVRAAQPQLLRMRQICYVILVLFGCMFMVTEYKENAANPVVWSFAPEILAMCFATLSLYYMAGYQFAEPKPYAGIFSCFTGVFFCGMCIIDKGISADTAVYLALVLLQGMFGFLQVENLQSPDGSAPEQ